MSVTIIGNSTVYTVKPARPSRADGPYGEHLPRLLRPSYDVSVASQARWFGMIDQGAELYESCVRSTAPDVVIVSYGINECMPRVLPNRLTAHLMASNRRRGVVRDWYRGDVLPGVWPWFRTVQRRGAAAAGLRTWRMSPRRFASELRRLVGLVRGDLCSLVLVVGIPPPAGDILWLLPHLDRRRDVFQKVLEGVVDEFDDDVRMVDTAPIVQRLGHERSLPDGMHFTAEAHRQVAEQLAGHIAGWLESQSDGPAG